MPIRIKDAGVSVSRRIPAGKLFVEATGELFRGDSGTIFRSTRRREISTVAHVRSYLDLTEATNFEAGISLAGTQRRRRGTRHDVVRYRRHAAVAAVEPCDLPLTGSANGVDLE